MFSKSAVTYNGKAQKPAVTVYAGNKKISGKYYTVSYKNNTAVGTAMITIQELLTESRLMSLPRPT